MKSIAALVAVAASALALAVVPATSAHAAGGTSHPASVAAHPAYLHALSDLRAARAHLQKRTGDRRTNWSEATAIAEIDAAIREIKAAAIDDGKSLEDHPPVDAGLDWTGRLHRARQLLSTAHADVKQEEDNPQVRDLQLKALGHIDGAAAAVDVGLAEIGK